MVMTANRIQRVALGLEFPLRLSNRGYFLVGFKTKPLDGLNNLIDIGINFNLPLLLKIILGRIEGRLCLLPQRNHKFKIAVCFGHLDIEIFFENPPNAALICWPISVPNCAPDFFGHAITVALVNAGCPEPFSPKLGIVVGQFVYTWVHAFLLAVTSGTRVVSHASEQSSYCVSLPVQLRLGGADLFELNASNGVLGPAEYPLSFCAEFCSDLTIAASRASFVWRSITRASTTTEFVFRTKSSRITIASPLKGGSGLTGKRGRKTANACGENASAMRTETTAYFILAAKNTFTEVLVSWRNRAVNVGNRTRCEFLQVKLSLDRPGLGSTLESTQARSRRDKFAIAFAAYRMPRVLTTLLPEDHRSVEKQSCKRQDNNGRPKYQNVCIAF